MERRDERLLDRDRAVVGADVAPRFEVVRFVDVPLAQHAGLVLVRAEVQAELARVKEAMDNSADRVTVVYIASTACMLSRFGSDGLNESLDGITRICLQLLYEPTNHRTFK